MRLCSLSNDEKPKPEMASIFVACSRRASEKRIKDQIQFCRFKRRTMVVDVDSDMLLLALHTTRTDLSSPYLMALPIKFPTA